MDHQPPLKIGGGNPRAQMMEGIHYHMLTENKVDYIAADEKRNEISWVRVTNLEGATTIYQNQEVNETPDPNLPGIEVRSFDCMDCHNRPSHIFLHPPWPSTWLFGHAAFHRSFRMYGRWGSIS